MMMVGGPPMRTMGPAGIKAAMELVGLAGGAPRSPLLPLGDADRARVEAMLRDAGVLGEARVG